MNDYQENRKGVAESGGSYQGTYLAWGPPG